MNVLGLVPGILKTLARVAGIDIFDKAADALRDLRLPPEKQLELQDQMQKHEQAMEALSIEKLKTVLSETQAMLASEDRFTSRARPTGLYVAYAISVGLAVAIIVGADVDAAAILTITAPLYGAQGYYMGLRTKEKLRGV